MTRRRQSGPRVAAGCVRIAVLFSPFGGATRTCQTDGSWTGTAPTSCGVFSGGQNLTPAMDAQLSTWMEQKGLSSAGGWQLCYSSPNGDLRDAASAWHSRCDGHVRTVGRDPRATDHVSKAMFSEGPARVKGASGRCPPFKLRLRVYGRKPIPALNVRI